MHALCSALAVAAAVTSSPAVAPPELASPELTSPMPGGVIAGYPVDTGLDIAGMAMPVFSIASGWLDYAEAGHSAWTSPRDSPFSVRIELDRPIAHQGRQITHVWYAHLASLAVAQEEGQLPRRHVTAGERLGTSGVANGSWHLHLGLLLDGDVSQAWGTFLPEAEVRQVLGRGLGGPGSPPLRAGSRLPRR